VAGDTHQWQILRQLLDGPKLASMAPTRGRRTSWSSDVAVVWLHHTLGLLGAQELGIDSQGYVGPRYQLISENLQILPNT
jgi:hypothetical protein